MPLVLRKEITPPYSFSDREREIEQIAYRYFVGSEHNLNNSAVREAIVNRSIPRAVENINLDAEALANASRAMADELVEALNNTEGLPRQAGIKYTFDNKDPRALEWAQNQAGRLVTRVRTEQQIAIRNTIAQAFSENRTVNQTMNDLKGIIGLTARQSVAYNNFIKNQVKLGVDRGLNPEQALAQSITRIEKYKNKLVRQRARTIARTEIAMAQMNGRYLAFTQTIEQGYMPQDSYKIWRTASYDVCDICGPMNRTITPWDQPFPNGVMMPPGHPNCRCSANLLHPDDAINMYGKVPAQPPSTPAIQDATPMPVTPQIPVQGTKSINEAIDDAFDNPQLGSNFAYDSDGIEDFRVHVNKVYLNGVETTEMRFKLAEGANVALAKNVLNKPNAGWVIDELNLEDVRPRRLGDGTIDANVRDVRFAVGDDFAQKVGPYEIRYPTINYEIQDTIASPPISFYAGNSYKGQAFTATKFLPDGTVLRFYIDQTGNGEFFNLAGNVRIYMTGKATPAQIEAALRELGIVNRYPVAQDVNDYIENRLIAFDANRKVPVTEKRSLLRQAQDNLGAVDEFAFAEASDGSVRVLASEKFQETLNPIVRNYTHDISWRNDAFINWLAGPRPQLLSTTERLMQGKVYRGASSITDIRSGGADYVFVRPTTEAIENIEAGGFKIIFSAERLHQRTDFFAYGTDAYGVTNPKVKGSFRRDPYTTNNIDELKIGVTTENSEAMFKHSIDLQDAVGIRAGNPDLRIMLIDQLKAKGVYKINGIDVEDFVVGPTVTQRLVPFADTTPDEFFLQYFQPISKLDKIDVLYAFIPNEMMENVAMIWSGPKVLIDPIDMRKVYGTKVKGLENPVEGSKVSIRFIKDNSERQLTLKFDGEYFRVDDMEVLAF